jgi:hypothetical protein
MRRSAWAARIKQGLETLVNSALKGKGAMPPQGGGDFSDIEITKAVVYMANSSGGSFEEPKAEGGEQNAEGGEQKAEGDAKPAGN